jgi:hypothetical protein
MMVIYLVGGLEHGFYDFPYIGNVIIPTDELIFFRGVGTPPPDHMVDIDHFQLLQHGPFCICQRLTSP